MFNFKVITVLIFPEFRLYLRGKDFWSNSSSWSNKRCIAERIQACAKFHAFNKNRV